ncbi:YIP1 family protein [Paenibacillus mendelii]|uniref:YIP1 family protein n=1 Tax=Paenibacillus mendelii TaxID=206163 RepID=A0ABV6JBJ2_9BACL|nr:YIP1 family protein [Paenibacillus mendelii]MCQ6558616.1 YIP1 family protein [Paenibacillus mendelii]
MKRIRRIVTLFLFLLAAAGAVPAAYAAPYDGYNYSDEGTADSAPVPYLPAKLITGGGLNAGSFKTPEDMYITKEGHIFVLDSGNHRVVELDSSGNALNVIESFDNGGKTDTFKEPLGIFVSDRNRLFVADTGNKRVVELTTDGEFIREIGPPKASILRANFTYVPTKLVVDTAGRLYVVSKGVFDGVIEFDSEGNFTGFIGVNKVMVDPVELFWKQISTKAQREAMALFIPVEFNNIDIDEEDFLYVTTSDGTSVEPVRRLNPSGSDVLRREGWFPPTGDIKVSFRGTRQGRSTIVSVASDTNGIYSILDTKRGRIFTYDKDGKLMYQFGALGEQFGQFKTPVEVSVLGDRIIVLDRGLNHLTVFEPTRYGEAIRNAVIYNDLGEESNSVKWWQEALKLNRNLEMAYLGIGKGELIQNNNYAAMGNFKLGTHPVYYSKAFDRYRKEWLWDHFPTIASVSVVAILLLIAAFKLIRVRDSEPGVVRSAWQTLFRPFNGFWAMKYEQKGRVWFTLLILLLLTIMSILRRQYSGFVINPVNDMVVNSLDELKFIVLPFFLWCVSNWSITTLMDGEGKFKEIVMATGLALIPLLLVQGPLLLFSRVITLKEVSFYSLIESFAYLWFVLLLFIGMLTVHQYNVFKTVVTMLLTLLVMGIIVFLGMLAASLAQQILQFGTTIYQEIRFRIGEG